MASAPRWKIYDHENEYRASCKYAEDAACLVALLGNGATIRDGHQPRAIRWTEGKESQPAHESYDFVAATVINRSDYR